MSYQIFFILYNKIVTLQQKTRNITKKR